ncbi:MAG: hypothetical protein AAB486_01210 [Patescibacteria group bacterium]|mgnify:CR=1 FL=1
MVKPTSPQTLAGYLSGIVLEPNAATVQVHGMVLHLLRERLPRAPILTVEIYRAHPNRVDELLVMTGQLYALLSALKALCQGRNPNEITFVSLPSVGGGRLVTRRKQQAGELEDGKSFPRWQFGLSKEQWDLPVREALGNSTKFGVRTVHLLQRAGMLTFGQLLLRTRGNPKRLLSLPGVGVKMLAIIEASFKSHGISPAKKKVGKKKAKSKKTVERSKPVLVQEPTSPGVPTESPV